MPTDAHTGKPAGASTHFVLLRNGTQRTVNVTLGPIPPPIPRTHGHDAHPEWLLIGGLLFAPLSAPLIEAASPEGSLPASVYELYMSALRSGWAPPRAGDRRAVGSQTIVLLDVLAAEVNYGYKARGWRVLSRFNGERPTSLVHLQQMWMAARQRDRFAEFAFTDGKRSIVLLTEECIASEARLLAQHGIPAAYGRDDTVYGRRTHRNTSSAVRNTSSAIVSSGGGSIFSSASVPPASAASSTAATTSRVVPSNQTAAITSATGAAAAAMAAALKPNAATVQPAVIEVVGVPVESVAAPRVDQTAVTSALSGQARASSPARGGRSVPGAVGRRRGRGSQRRVRRR